MCMYTHAHEVFMHKRIMCPCPYACCVHANVLAVLTHLRDETDNILNALQAVGHAIHHDLAAHHTVRRTVNDCIHQSRLATARRTHQSAERAAREPAPSQLGSDQLGSDQLGSDQLGSDQLGSNQLGSKRLEARQGARQEGQQIQRGGQFCRTNLALTPVSRGGVPAGAFLRVTAHRRATGGIQ